MAFLRFKALKIEHFCFFGSAVIKEQYRCALQKPTIWTWIGVYPEPKFTLNDNFGRGLNLKRIQNTAKIELTGFSGELVLPIHGFRNDVPI
jgi:hypothetical protein